MFGIGGMELFIILLVALIVLGPNKLPDLARMLGKAMGELQRATGDLKNEIDIAGEHKAAASPPKTDGGKEATRDASSKNSPVTEDQVKDDEQGG